MSQRSRVPLPAQVDLAGVNLSIQVNHCKTPDCANFGVPARTEPARPARLHNALGGRTSAIGIRATNTHATTGGLTMRQETAESSTNRNAP